VTSPVTLARNACAAKPILIAIASKLLQSSPVSGSLLGQAECSARQTCATSGQGRAYSAVGVGQHSPPITGQAKLLIYRIQNSHICRFILEAMKGDTAAASAIFKKYLGGSRRRRSLYRVAKCGRTRTEVLATASAAIRLADGSRRNTSRRQATLTRNRVLEPPDRYNVSRKMPSYTSEDTSEVAMPKPSPRQRKTMGRVMHEFKHGAS
jgi:hypothetical protein